MDTSQKQKILRYAQLSFKRAGLEQRHLQLPLDECSELESILEELKMTHEQVLDLAEKNLIDSSH